MKKSSVNEIKERFDNDVERFSDLGTGQTSTVDARISLELTTEAARRLVPHAQYLLDIGCGAGNYTIMMLQKLPGLNCTLVDLSKPMLDKAFERVSQNTRKPVNIMQGDIREADLIEDSYDIILAGAVLHHLRDDHDWEFTFRKLFRLLRKGGCLMISDLVSHETESMTEFFMEKYGDYLLELGGAHYRDRVLDYIEREDSPRPMTYQLELMRSTGFRNVEILHKHLCFGAFGGLK